MSDTKEYQPTEEDIELLKKQISVDNTTASELLTKYKGNFVMAMMEYHNVSTPKQEVFADISGKSTMAKELTETELEDESVNKYISDIQPVFDLLGENSNHQLMKTCRTYVIIDLTPNTHTFSKRKRYASLEEVIEQYREHLTPPENQIGLNIYPVQGELLFKWSMINAGMVIYASQIRDNKSIVADGILPRINKSATLIARSCGHITNDHCIIDGTFLINNVNWSLK